MLEHACKVFPQINEESGDKEIKVGNAFWFLYLINVGGFTSAGKPNLVCAAQQLYEVSANGIIHPCHLCQAQLRGRRKK